MGLWRVTHRVLGYLSGMVFRAEGKERLDRFLSRMLPDHSRSRLAKVIAGGDVRVEGEPQTKAGFELRPGWEVSLGEIAPPEPHDLTPADIPLNVVYEDEHVLVVAKPRGMATHPAPGLHEPSLVNALLSRSHALSTEGGAFRPGIVHRLDKDTTGLLMVAKSDQAHRRLAEQIRTKQAERRYVAWVVGSVAPERFTIDAPIGRHPGIPSLMAVKRTGKGAVTHVRVLRAQPDRSLVALKLETGRTHQIRVHLASIGHEVLGDRQYARADWKSGPMQLHAAALAFDHPFGDERVTCWTPPPDDFGHDELLTRESVTDWN